LLARLEITPKNPEGEINLGAELQEIGCWKIEAVQEGSEIAACARDVERRTRRTSINRAANDQ